MVNALLSIFLAKGKLSLALSCLRFSVIWVLMMSTFVKKGYFSQACGVLDDMGEKVCPADVATYNVKSRSSHCCSE
jgi:pentatricopeptide repeat protein